MEIKAAGLRVYLKNPTLDDVDTLAELANDYEIVYNVAQLGRFPYPYRKEDAISFINRSAEDFNMGVGVHLAIHLVEDNSFIGMVGLKDISTSRGIGDLGYWVGKKYWGNGYGSEAVRLMVSYAFERLHLKKLTAVSFVFNDRSLRLLNSIGFRIDTVMREGGYKNLATDDSVFSLTAEEHSDEIKIEII